MKYGLKHMPDDRGGSVLLRAGSILMARGPKLLPRYASSAGTMWLGYRNAFVDPYAQFGFHAVSRDITGIATRIYEAHLRAAHPQLLEWFRDVPNNSKEMVRVSGNWLIREGWATSIKDY